MSDIDPTRSAQLDRIEAMLVRMEECVFSIELRLDACVEHMMREARVPPAIREARIIAPPPMPRKR